ncbi:MAG: acyltransferase family protein [Gammaproteobacteria bacterium]
MLSHQESFYFDLVRLSAAVAVVVTHLIQYSLLPLSWQPLVPDLGREAVIVFFVLSGYLIAYIAEQKYDNVEAYFVSRATRLYSVALPVLLLAFCIDTIGIKFLGGEYSHLYQYEKFYLYIPFHLLFLGEVWTLAERPFSADPYWSLSFEAWYYVWFATLFYFSGWRRVFLFTLVALIIGYQHWLLFPIWLSGVWLYHQRGRWKLSPRRARKGMGLSVLVVLLLEYTGLDLRLWQLGIESWPFDGLPQGSTDQYLLDYVVCICTIVHLHCVRYAQLEEPKFVSKIVRALAAYTFTLYLTHTIVMQTWQNNFKYDNENLWSLALLCCLIVIVTYMVGALTEKRRHLFKPPIAWAVNMMSKYSPFNLR